MLGIRPFGNLQVGINIWVNLLKLVIKKQITEVDVWREPLGAPGLQHFIPDTLWEKRGTVRLISVQDGKKAFATVHFSIVACPG